MTPTSNPTFFLSAAAICFSALVARAPAATPDELALLAELKSYPYKIVHESFRDGHWVLIVRNADGSNPVTLTRPGVNENYPHVSPDGKKITFESESGEGEAKRRDIYMMNMDGSDRTLVAEAARDACWTPDGKSIVYLKDEFNELQYRDFATKGVFIYDLATGKSRQHVNHDLHHLYNICCTPDGAWLVATVHAGMGYSHAILAIEADGKGVFNLGIPGCRPDVSGDGKCIAWGGDDTILRIANFKVVKGKPKVTDARTVATSEHPIHIYHIDWSPDGRYVAFSRGPTRKAALGTAPEVVGIKAEGWNICVADATKKNRCVAITSDGHSNKEPDWFKAAK
jgi:Tol biopolymer transport system component